MKREKFLGLDCVFLKNKSLELLVTESVGPRIIRLSLTGGDNLLAELPDLTIESPDGDSFHFWGGHRLWHAPEVKRRTCLPDNEPVAITEIEQGLVVAESLPAATGIQKSLTIILPDDSAKVVIDHTLTNLGLWQVELAPWAITMMKPGGVAVLPQVSEDVDPDGVLPNRRLTLWPYTDINSPYIDWGNHFIQVHARVKNGPLKIGFPNPAGWLAYVVDQTLFVKLAVYLPQATYPDFGSSSECYCQPEFIELETLGPLTRLGPGETVTHREIWRLYPDISFEPGEEAIEALASRLSL